MCTHYTQVKDSRGAEPTLPTSPHVWIGIICSFSIIPSPLQIVWATTNRIGCAVNVCKQMNVWGEIWENAVYLVCNYSPK